MIGGQDRKTVPTLSDVARHAGVSTATVSRCLNTPDRVIETTRQRVLQAVRDLGYAPNFGARALAAKRTNTIGAVIPTMDNAIFARGLQAFQEELHSNGITLLVSSSQYSPDIEEEQIRALVARGADALLLIGYHRSDEIYRFLRARSVPALVAWVHEDGAEELAIGFDNRAAMKALAEKVLDFGHRRLGFISAERDSNDRARARVEGVRDALRARGLPVESLVVIDTPYAIENGAEACKDLLLRSEPPSVILCGNDVLAVGAMQGARRMGASVPDDLSITGFDDIELATVVDPPLTTVHVPHREMGRQAAQMLVGLLNGDHGMAARKLETSLRLRGTLAPVSEISENTQST